jgi:hypothetical protein
MRCIFWAKYGCPCPHNLSLHFGWKQTLPWLARKNTLSWFARKKETHYCLQPFDPDRTCRCTQRCTHPWTRSPLPESYASCAFAKSSQPSRPRPRRSVPRNIKHLRRFSQTNRPKPQRHAPDRTPSEAERSGGEQRTADSPAAPSVA